MKFTFGIIAKNQTQELINSIESIKKLNIPEYEIIVIGGGPFNLPGIKIISFDENKRSGWITKKKNILVQNAKYENISLSHDYIEYKPDWYEGFLKFGDNFDICMTKMINFHEEREDNRYRDWTLWILNPQIKDGLAAIGAPHNAGLLPYNETKLQKWQYISGAYWVAKKHIMLQNPLNESLGWGEGEDIEWSFRINNKVRFSMNQFSTVKVGKMNNHRNFDPISDEHLLKLKKYLNIKE